MATAFIHAGKRTSINQAPKSSIYLDSTRSFRRLMLPEQVMRPRVMPRLLVLDDDRNFLMLMRRAAEKTGATVTCCQSIEEFSRLDLSDFDAIIVDFDLGSVTGFEIASYLEDTGPTQLPVVLVSQSKRSSSVGWPKSIREFVHKGLGPFAILDATFEAHEISRMNAKIYDVPRMN